MKGKIYNKIFSWVSGAIVFNNYRGRLQEGIPSDVARGQFRKVMEESPSLKPSL